MIHEFYGLNRDIIKKADLLASQGYQDASIPLAEVRGFELAMQARGIPHQVTVYPGVGHAFVTSASLAQPGAAQQAWAEMLAFLAKNLKGQAAAETPVAALRPADAPATQPGGVLSFWHGGH